MRFFRTEKSHGYTLIELSIVLFLVGLFFFISMPRLGIFLFQTDLKDAARSLKATVNILRSKSISTHVPTILHLDLDQGLYWGSFARRDGEETDSGELTRKPFLIHPRKLPEGVRFLDASNINTQKKSFGQMSSIFTPKGALEETVIHLADGDQHVLTIIVNAYTGRFSIFDEYVDVEYAR
jgi:prepilin-type N-terminal cleavage/methylation domain-containing protein